MREYIATLEGLDEGAIEEVTTDGLANPASRGQGRASARSSAAFQGQQRQLANNALARLSEAKARAVDRMNAIKANPNPGSAARIQAMRNQVTKLNAAMQRVATAGAVRNTMNRAGANFRGVDFEEF